VELALKLRQARDKCGLTLQGVSEHVPAVGVSSLSEYENGKREPSVSQLQILAKLYRRPISFFLDDTEFPAEVVLWRERPNETEEIEGEFLQLCRRYHHLETWLEKKEPSRLPELEDHIPPSGGYPKVNAFANRVRGNLCLGSRPSYELKSVLEETCGVKIFYMDFEPTGTAASTRSEDFGSAILLNRSNVRWRRNFDLAHELFHLLTWSIYRTPESASDEGPRPEEETYANDFASSLLMPEEAIRDAATEQLNEGKLSFSSIHDIARQFDVSAAAVLYRLRKIKFLDMDWDATKEATRVLGTRIHEKEERQDTHPSGKPDRYRALASEALQSGNISIGKFAEYMDISRHEAMSYVQQEPMDGQKIPVASA
jgi:Zn-dependent peptidase ImmA (M78 family)/transcriptional regulator with XRE-family HTH domain